MALTGIIACFFYNAWVYTIRTWSNLEGKLWDLKTVTTADFAVKVRLPEEVWTKWLAHSMKMKKSKSADTGGTNPEKDCGKPIFRDFVIQEFEKQMLTAEELFKNVSAGNK